MKPDAKKLIEAQYFETLLLGGRHFYPQYTRMLPIILGWLPSFYCRAAELNAVMVAMVAARKVI